jgi:DNA primase
MPKYINTAESLIYEKRKTLLGLDTALVEAKRNGLYIVEGPGDLAAMHKIGIKNAAAICGAAFTSDHLTLLKMLGIYGN